MDMPLARRLQLTSFFPVAVKQYSYMPLLSFMFCYQALFVFFISTPISVGCFKWSLVYLSSCYQQDQRVTQLFCSPIHHLDVEQEILTSRGQFCVTVICSRYLWCLEDADSPDPSQPSPGQNIKFAYKLSHDETFKIFMKHAEIIYNLQGIVH